VITAAVLHSRSNGAFPFLSKEVTMADPNFQLTPPFSNWGTGYKPPDFFGDRFKLKLDQPYASSQLGWTAQMQNGQVLNLGADLPGGIPGVTDSFTTICAAIARSQTSSSRVDPNPLAQLFRTTADNKVWDTLYGLLRQAGPNLWPDVPGNKPNIVTKKPASDGKVDPSGVVVPPGPGDSVAGTGIPLPAISVGRRFPFASDPDVQLYIYLDKDAYPQQPNLLLTGGGVSIEGKTSWGDTLKLRFGAGRGAAGGPASFFTIQLGPDYVPQTPSQP
jgi:hypothetical protein